MRVVEPLAVLSCAYLSYMLAELVSFSGDWILPFPTFPILLTSCYQFCQFYWPLITNFTNFINLLPGIISLIGCGIVQAHYAFKNISDKSETTIKYFIAMLRFETTLNEHWIQIRPTNTTKTKLMKKLHQFHHGLYHLPVPWDGRSWGCAGINLTCYPNTT